MFSSISEATYRCHQEYVTALLFLADSESEEEDFVDNFLQEEEGSDFIAPKPPKIPHRWRVTIMMALAFVLCNMDKVDTAEYIQQIVLCIARPHRIYPA